ncbi:MAG: N-formylglutamate amidohydrolase [Azospirillum sp.]|nr:N-formylglutamate amidohydrolase [Azospirillum sp.]
MSLVIEDVLVRSDPVDVRVPVVFDSPHSGIRYPAGFGFTCPLGLLRQAEDAFVDDIFEMAPEFGATLIAAQFPRSFIDANRAIDDLDPRLIDGLWREALHPTEKSALGMGLIWSVCKPGVPVYDGRLTVAEVAERIDRYWRPYHGQLEAVLGELARSFGAVWHVNCHSMPSSNGIGRAESAPRPDFVIGDRDGTTSEPGFVAFVAEVLRNRGYRVALNAPYKGVELVRRYADPARGRSSIQLEINRALYMDEETLEKHHGFEQLREHITDLVSQICSYADQRTGLRQAAE